MTKREVIKSLKGDLTRLEKAVKKHNKETNGNNDALKVTNVARKFLSIVEEDDTLLAETELKQAVTAVLFVFVRAPRILEDVTNIVLHTLDIAEKNQEEIDNE